MEAQVLPCLVQVDRQLGQVALDVVLDLRHERFWVLNLNEPLLEG